MTYNANFLTSTSAKVSLTVQQAAVSGYSEAPVPLPTQYWTQPIDAQNRAWNSIAGPWLQSGYNSTGAYNPYTYAPDSAHIIWTQDEEAANGGLIGGNYGSLEFARTTGYSTPIVMGGDLYFNGPPQVQTGVDNNVIGGNGLPLTNTPVSYIYCENIQTGKIVWTAPGSITNGQILNWRSQQSKSEIPYLWSIGGGSYKLYSAYTGALLDQWSNQVIAGVSASASAGTVVLQEPSPAVIGEDIGGAGGGGALLVFSSGYNDGQSTMWLSCWNSTQALNAYSGTANWAGQPLPSTNPVVWSLPPVTANLNWNLGLMWNVSIPFIASDIQEGGISTYVNGRQVPLTILGADQNYVVLKNTEQTNNATGACYMTMLCFNAQTGALVWEENVNLPPYDTTFGQWGLESNGLIIQADKELDTIFAYSESTGALLWSVDPYNNDFSYQSISIGVEAFGMSFFPGYDGYMHAINDTTGKQVWNTISRTGGLEMPQPAYPMSGITIAGTTAASALVFTSTAKGYEAEPLYRGHCLYAFDAATGAQVWNISGQYSNVAVADGILVATNNYDSEVFAFSRGPTATTVSAPGTATVAGTPIVLTGSVTDQTPQFAGTPAISDTWMTPWMQYLTMDQPYPTQATGVNVVITAVDPNHNLITIGNATSDISGSFSYLWTPPNVPGKYTIIATFNSDNSYYGSCGETATAVVLATSATPAPTATPTSVADMYFVPAIAGLFVLIIVGLIVLALLVLRKRA